MNRLLEHISNHPAITLTGWGATMVGLIITIFLPFVQRRRKKLSFQYSTNVLITNKLSEIEGLDICYNGKGIEQLSVSSFLIINSGNVTINNQDLYSGHELKIVPAKDSDVIIQYAKMVSQSRDIVDCNVLVKDNSTTISFQAFEKKDYVNINIYHTGDISSSFDVVGIIKEGKIVEAVSDRKRVETIKHISDLIMLVVCLIFVAYSLILNVPLSEIISKMVLFILSLDVFRIVITASGFLS